MKNNKPVLPKGWEKDSKTHFRITRTSIIFASLFALGIVILAIGSSLKHLVAQEHEVFLVMAGFSPFVFAGIWAIERYYERRHGSMYEGHYP